ncbi:MAG: hypothetical protein FJ035_08490 [Chloroflexi bacterium]|nr:hypothetical protein [Chloroflexota bacterium]
MAHTGAALDSYVEHKRDAHGVVYAVEVVTAEAWADVLEEPSAVERADMRVVRLQRGRAPGGLPD